MKKLQYIIVLSTLLLLGVSCAREMADPAVESVEEPTVPIILSFDEPITLQAETKANTGMEMGITPAIQNIHVAVFGSSGYLKDYTSATPCDASGNPIADFASTNATASYFLCRLPVSTSSRIVHIIANGPSSMTFNAYENDIMQRLSVTDGNGAYWQRIVLDHGISVKTVTNTEGQIVYEEDADGNYIPTDETVEAFAHLKLVRNFTSVTVDVASTASNFQLVSYTLCNMAQSGSYAIYSTNHGAWVSDYMANPMDGSTGIISYDGKVYAGFPTNPVLNTTIPSTADEFNAAGVAVGPGEPMYVYERAVTSENPPFILMAGRWVESGDPSSAPVKYYRLDITKDDEYIPLYRNYSYNITLTGVSVEGFDTPEQAARHNSGDNFSVSLDTQTLDNVSNGTIRIYVEQPAYDLIYTSDEQRFWFQLQKVEDGSYLNGNVTVTEKPGGNALASFTVGTSDVSDKRYVSYTLNMPNGTSTLTSTLKLVGTYTDSHNVVSRLNREVTIHVFNTKDITPTLTPDTVAPEANQTTTLGIPLPWDLQKSMFPMEILIEDSEKALNPSSKEDMPVRTEIKSLTDNATPSYCFVRTLNWSEYAALKEDAELSGNSLLLLNCEFDTIKEFTSTTVYVYNKYFSANSSGVTTAQVTLGTDANNLISPSKQTVTGTSANVTVKSAGRWSLMISLANGETATGTSITPNFGNATTGTAVTVTLPENDSENAIRYKLTLVNTTDNITRNATLTQAGVSMSMTCSKTSIAATGENVSVAVNSGVHYLLEALDENGNVLSSTATYDATTTTTNRSINVPANDRLTDRNVTIRLRNVSGTIRRDITLPQAAGTATMTAPSSILMSTTSATVNVAASFDSVLNVYDESDALIFTTNVASNTSGTNVNIPLGANTTGSDRTFTVKLCNTSGTVVRTESITQAGTPSISLVADNDSVKGNTTSATLTLIAELDWTLSVSGGSGSPSLSVTSGNSTSGTTVTLSGMPVNYSTTAEVTYTVTATSSDASIVRTATITQRVATLNPNQSVTFNTTTGNGYTNSDYTETKNGITGTFSAINSVGGSYMTLASGTQLTVSKDVTVYAITGATFTYSSTTYDADSMTATTGTVSSATAWTGSTDSVTFTFTRNGWLLSDLRMTRFVITYTGYTWN